MIEKKPGALSVAELVRNAERLVKVNQERMSEVTLAKRKCISISTVRDQLINVSGDTRQQKRVEAIELIFNADRMRIDIFDVMNAYEVSQLLLPRVNEALSKAKEELEALLDA